MSLSYQAIYSRVKEVIAGLKRDLEPPDIYADMELAKPPLRFNALGRRALAAHLNARFSDAALNITKSETEACKTVREVSRRIYKKVGTP